MPEVTLADKDHLTQAVTGLRQGWCHPDLGVIREDVTFLGPDGKILAIARRSSTGYKIEYPKDAPSP